MRVVIGACPLVALMILPVAAWAWEVEPDQGTPVSGMPAAGTTSGAALPLPAPGPSTGPNFWAGFYANKGGTPALSDGGSTALQGLSGPGGVSAAQEAAGMTHGALGANWQTGDTVIGLQGDLQWSDPSAAVVTDCDLGCSLNDHARVPWQATLRARAGKSFDNLFVYGTGGFASFGAASNLAAGGIGSTPNLGDLSAGTIDWSIGGGMEVSLDKNVSAKIEYMRDTPTTGAGSLFDSDAKNTVVRGGFDYRLPVDKW